MSVFVLFPVDKMGNITCHVRITITYRPLLIVLRTLRKYWASVYTTTLPMIIVPIILELKDKFAKCIYTIALMTGLWCFDSIPHTVISLLPQVSKQTHTYIYIYKKI